jgi:hypothetical protein
MQRVENLVGTGTPDVEGFYRKQFWIELKAVGRPINGHIDVEVSPEQVAWHRRRQRAGGATWFLIQVGSGHGAKRYLIPGHRADALHPDCKPWQEKTLQRIDMLDGGENAPNMLKTLGF